MTSAELIKKLQGELDALSFRLRVVEQEYEELQSDYECACLDLDATRKELLRATS